MFDQKTRKVIYTVIAVLGVVVGTLNAVLSSLGDMPAWMDAVNAAYTYLAGGSGILAVINTPAPQAEVVEAAEDIAAEKPRDDGTDYLTQDVGAGGY